MAAASGLHLVPKKKNPLITTTRGTGELILAAVNEGIKHIIIGLGGSATNDGGVGMAKALGVKFLDKEGNLIKDGGGYLNTLHAIDTSNLDKRLENISEVACDVNITLTGDKGASAVFGPQKGATEEMVKTLDDNLTHFANIVSRDLKVEIKNIPGSGAAGGLGAGLIAFLGAEMKSGIDMVVSTTNLEKKMKGANLVITGEGKVDGQSFYGKTPIGVAKIAKRYNIPVIIITGNISDESGEIYNFGIDAMFSVLPRVMTLSDAYKYSRLNIERTIENIARLIKSMKLYLKK